MSIKKETYDVSQRVLKTKQEIEQLKLNLQQLVSNNVNGNIKDQNGTNNDRNDDDNVQQPDAEKEKDSMNNISHRKRKLKLEIPKKLVNDENPSPNRTKHYDVKEAREYMKKQKEKREQLKRQTDQKVIQNDMKKQKLRELHQKAQQLVIKNVQLKRERSKSRDRNEEVRINAVASKPIRDRSNSRNRPDSGSLKDTKHALHSNITQRSRNKSRDNKMVAQSQNCDNLAQNNVPDKNPNLLYPLSDQKMNVLEKTFYPVTEERAINPNVVCHKETQTCDKKKSVPNWLQPQLTPYPHNFINTVRRKLNYAITTPAVELEKKPEKIKNREEIKEILTKSESNSLKSFLSHRCLKESQQESDSDTSRNIPDISTESKSISQTKKETYTLDFTEGNTTKYENLVIPQHSIISSHSIKKSSKSSSSSASSIPIVSGIEKTSYDTLEIPKSSLILSNLSRPSTSRSIPTEKKIVILQNITLSYDENAKAANMANKNFLDIPKLKSPEPKDVNSKTSHSSPTSNITSLSTADSIKQKLLDSESSNKSSVSECLSDRTETKSLEKIEEFLEESQIPLKLNEENNRLFVVNDTLKNNNINNEIHLKFEAEVHLLNDFHESINQLKAVEEAFQNVKNKNDCKVLQNADTQTSVILQTDPHSKVTPSRKSTESLSDTLDNFNLTSTLGDSMVSTGFELSTMNGSSITENDLDIPDIDNNVNNCGGFSVKMLDQLIKDEDSRIKNLKAVINLREKALLDRTKSELVYLEIQRKRLIENGKIEEASLLKKRQRGIILKHEQERNEMKRLKQMQKEAANERKNLLKEQRNLIKKQLSTNNMMSKLKITMSKERHQSGPIKVFLSQSLKDSCKSNNSAQDEEELRSSQHSQTFSGMMESSGSQISQVKRKLFMKEAELYKRRKAVSDLLRWHQKLTNEEEKLNKLEKETHTIINRTPSKINEKIEHLERHVFYGQQLNQLWKTMTGEDCGKFVDDKIYTMSQLALERFCESAKNYTNNRYKTNETERSDEHNHSTISTFNENTPKSEIESVYTSDFDVETTAGEEEDKLSSISMLIDNIRQVEKEILSISKHTDDTVLNKESILISEIGDQESEQKFLDGEKKNSTETVPTDISSEKSIISEVQEEPLTVQSFPDSVKVDLVPENKSNTSSDANSEVEEISNQSSSNYSGIVNDIKEKPIKHAISEKDTVPLEIIQQEETTIFKNEEKDEQEILSQNHDTIKSIVISDATQDNVEDIRSDSISNKIEESQLETEEKSLEITVDEIVTSHREENSGTSISEEFTQHSSENLDIRKRISEILGEREPNRNERSPQVQDIYVTTYDVISSDEGTTSSISTISVKYTNGYSVESEDDSKSSKHFGNEAEELLKKQLAIEQEIKELEQQQKDTLPYGFFREIPNKPPPPYTPPASLSVSSHILPSDTKEIDVFTEYSSKILHKAYMTDGLDKVKFSENSFKLVANTNNIRKQSCEFMFNICKELAKDSYKQFEKEPGPSWFILKNKTNRLSAIQPLDADGLNRMLNKKLKELFGFSKIENNESVVAKLSQKKRDHVDEILVAELREEECQWRNFDRDELIVRNDVTNDILEMLIVESVGVFNRILTKKICK